jgi:flagellar hook protein FlgE
MAYLGTLTTATSALQSFSAGLNDVGNNIANVNTTGYKSTTASYSNTFSGLGVQVAAQNVDLTQGALTTTGVPSQLAISGNGYFLVQTVPQSGGVSQTFATRDGTFTVDPSGYFVSPQGYRLLGTDPQNNSGVNSVVNVPVQIHTPYGNPGSALAVASFAVDANGFITQTLSDGEKVPQAQVPQVLLMKFTTPQALQSVGNNLFANLIAAGPTNLGNLTTPNNVPNTNGLGTVVGGALENSNVDLTSQFTNLITLQRSFDANAHVITTTDGIMQTIVDLKRS